MTEPTNVRAGDTWTWTVTDADYADYTMTYHLRNERGFIDVPATADGNDYTVSVSAVTTATYRPGTYSWIRRVVGDLGTFTTGSGTVEVLANLALAVARDGRSLARVMLDNIEEYLRDENNLTAASYSISGRSLSRWSRTELLAEREKLRTEVRSEIAAERVATGLGNPRRLYARF